MLFTLLACVPSLAAILVFALRQGLIAFRRSSRQKSVDASWMMRDRFARPICTKKCATDMPNTCATSEMGNT